MKNNQTFDKFKSKLALEAVLNSIMSSLSVGFSLAGLISLITWLCGYKSGVWITLGVGLGASVIAFPLFYFLKFRPSAQQTGRRVDSLGLQERAVTMLENLDDQSYMATRQRLDAVSHIEAASTSALKMSVSALVGIAFAVSVAVGVPFITVETLYSGGMLASPAVPLDPMEQYVAVSYFADEGGEILGEEVQLCSPGDDAASVVAQAFDGYVFSGWSDGNTDPYREDLKITEDFEVTARFDPIPDETEGGGEGIDAPGTGDADPNQPGEPGEVWGGDGDGDGNGNPGEGEGQGEGDGEKGEGKADGKGDGAGGQWSDSSKIINNSIYYRDLLDMYYLEAMEELAQIEDLPQELREFIEAYFNGL